MPSGFVASSNGKGRTAGTRAAKPPDNDAAPRPVQAPEQDDELTEASSPVRRRPFARMGSALRKMTDNKDNEVGSFSKMSGGSFAKKSSPPSPVLDGSTSRITNKFVSKLVDRMRDSKQHQQCKARDYVPNAASKVRKTWYTRRDLDGRIVLVQVEEGALSAV